MRDWGQWSLQDANSPIMEEFIFFHDFTLVILGGILGLVVHALAISLNRKEIHKGLLEGQTVERIWTVIPALVLVQVAIPSLLLLYTLDEALSSALTIKAVGHQWYWRYEYSDFWREKNALEFDRYISPRNRGARLLETDNHAVVPMASHVRVLISSADVLHAWTVPSLGVKADACPGRLNQVRFRANRPGLFYGQCSEICGANHRFMPIVVESVPGPTFLSWLVAETSDE